MRWAVWKFSLLQPRIEPVTSNTTTKGSRVPSSLHHARQSNVIKYHAYLPVIPLVRISFAVWRHFSVYVFVGLVQLDQLKVKFLFLFFSHILKIDLNSLQAFHRWVCSKCSPKILRHPLDAPRPGKCPIGFHSIFCEWLSVQTASPTECRVDRPFCPSLGKFGPGPASRKIQRPTRSWNNRRKFSKMIKI